MHFPKIMAIVNVTPDSFSDGGAFLDFQKALDHSLKLLDEGADILDIGGESTRPGASEVSTEEEMQRVIPLVKEIKRLRAEAIISVDTTKYEVAKAALDNGVNYINDISGLTFEPRLADLCAEYSASLILMHIKGTPRTMQHNPTYNDVVSEVYAFLKEKATVAKEKGVKQVIVDTGIGFGKTLEHNLELIRNQEKFQEIADGVLIGISRKSFLNHLLKIENPLERDFPTSIFHTLLIGKGVDIVRLHNMKEMSLIKQVYNAFYGYK